MSQKILTELLSQIPAQYKNSDLPLFIVGPTASGKTALSLALAQNSPAAVISADSRQIYLELDIATGKEAARPKPYQNDLIFEPYNIQNIPHYLLDILPPTADYTMFDFKSQCERLLKDLKAQGQRTIIAGGTGLYVESVIYNYQLATPHNISQDANIRQQVELDYRNLLTTHDKEQACQIQFERLLQLDPISAQQLHANNVHGVQRALEFALLTKQSKTQQKTTQTPNFEFQMIYLKPDRQWLYQRIDARVVAMFEAGLIQETQNLIQKYSKDLKALSSIGYKQVCQYLAGQCTKEQAIAEMQKLTRNYAKRQYTWFNRYSEQNFCLTLEYPQQD